MNTRTRTPIVIALVALALIAAPHWTDPNTLAMLLIYGLLALSLGYSWGVGGILCFGQSAFFGLGAYAYAIAAINFGESTVPVLLAVAVPSLFAAALGAMMFYARIGDVYLGVITLVVTLILFKFVNSTSGESYAIGAAHLGGFNGIPGFPILNLPGMADRPIAGAALYYVCAAALALAWLACRYTLSRPLGRVLAGVRENDLRAQLLGYDTRALKTAAFVIGAGIAGMAGALYASWAEIVTPALFSLGQSAEIIMWVLIGGLGTLTGPVLGALLLGWIKLRLGAQEAIDNSLVMGAILVFIVLSLPNGIYPACAGLWHDTFARLRRSERGAAPADDNREPA